MLNFSKRIKDIIIGMRSCWEDTNIARKGNSGHTWNLYRENKLVEGFILFDFALYFLFSQVNLSLVFGRVFTQFKGLIQFFYRFSVLFLTYFLVGIFWQSLLLLKVLLSRAILQFLWGNFISQLTQLVPVLSEFSYNCTFSGIKL